MGNPQVLSLSLHPQKDAAIICWYQYVKTHAPRYASLYVREAIKYYMNHQIYLNIGTICMNSYEASSSVQTRIGFVRTPELNELILILKERNIKAAPYIRSILSKSIKVVSEGENSLPVYSDIVELDFSDHPMKEQTSTSTSPASTISNQPVTPVSIPKVEEAALRESISHQPQIAPLPPEKKIIKKEISSGKNMIMSQLGSAFDDD